MHAVNYWFFGVHGLFFTHRPSTAGGKKNVNRKKAQRVAIGKNVRIRQRNGGRTPSDLRVAIGKNVRIRQRNGR